MRKEKKINYRYVRSSQKTLCVHVQYNTKKNLNQLEMEPRWVGLNPFSLKQQINNRPLRHNVLLPRAHVAHLHIIQMASPLLPQRRIL